MAGANVGWIHVFVPTELTQLHQYCTAGMAVSAAHLPASLRKEGLHSSCNHTVSCRPGLSNLSFGVENGISITARIFRGQIHLVSKPI